MADKEPTWIYQADGAAKIVDLAREEAAPKGWSRCPTVIEDESKRTANAISGVQPPPLFGTDLDIVPGRDVDAAVELQAAQERIAELELRIQGGSAQNENLQAELLTAEEEMAKAAAAITDLQQRLADAEAGKQAAIDQIGLLRGELERARASIQPAAEPVQSAENDGLKRKRA